MKIKLIIFFVAFFFIPINAQTLESIQKDIESRNNDLDQIKQDIKNLENKINKKIKEEATTQEILDQLDNKIKLTEKLIYNLNREENYLSNLIYKNEENILIKEKELRILQNQLKNRVRYLYKYGRNEILNEFANISDWNKIIYRTKYLQILNQSEAQIKKRININIENLTLEKKALQKEKDRKSYLIKEKDKEFKSLENDKKIKQDYILKIRNQKIKLKADLKIKKDMMAEIEGLINKLYSDKKELKKREEELIKLRAQRNKSTSGNFANMKNKLPWPVNGEVVGKFGIQSNDKLNTQYENIGIDIKTKQFSTVKSILDGVITSVTMIKGYGNVVIIDHGDGYYSVYSNIDNIRVNEGDYIQALTQIGTVAKNNSSNYIADYLFHFQIWGNKKKLNPENWLKRK